MGQRNLSGGSKSANDRLLFAVAEQMKMPLLHIARTAELGAEGSLKLIESAAERTLQFIDSYLLSSQILANQLQLELEPVTLSSVLADTAESLQKIALEYGCHVRVELAGKYGPVMANRLGLEAALINIGTAIIEAGKYDDAKKPELLLAVHASSGGIVAGVFSELKGFNLQALRRARELQGRARQPFNESLAGSGAGIFVADVVLGAMSTKLRVAHYHKLSGLAATFLPSQQLALV